MAKDRNSNQIVVQQARAALEQLKFEVAQELGIQIPADGYYGNMITRDTGRIGGNITRRLIQIAEQQLAGQYPRSSSLEYVTRGDEGGGGTGGPGSDLIDAAGRFTTPGGKGGNPIIK
jgi:hypothetical protein